MAIPPLVLRIYADSSGVQKGVAQAQAQVGGLRASVAKNAGLIKAGLVGGVVAGLAVSIKAAGDLGEAINATNVTFKGNAQVVKTWAKQAATSAGLAEAEALQAASGMGAMFESAGLAGEASAKMSVDVAQLAGDIASLRNADPTEMLERMRAGLSGEAEPLRRFGIFISEARVQQEAFRAGIAETGEELTDAQKIQARYNIILKDASEAQGDFARTAGTSLPNQLRMLRANLINLAATFGKVLLPAITFVLKALNAVISPLAKVIDLFTSVQDPVREATEELKEFGLANDLIREKVQDTIKPFTDQEDALRGGRTMGAAAAVALEDLVDAEQRAAEVAEGWAAKQKMAQEELITSTGAVRRFRNVTSSDFKEWAATAAEQFNAVQAGLDNLAGKTKLTADKIINQFNRQAENLRNYRTNLADLAQRNIPDELLQQLVDMGIGGADIVAELATASDRKFDQMVGAMRRAATQTDKLERKIRDLRNQLLEVEGTYNATINLRVNGANPAGFEFGQRQHGGPVSAGMPYIVGERGPELFVPNQPGTVVANDQIAGPQHIHVHIGEEEVDRIVVKGLKRAAART